MKKLQLRKEIRLGCTILSVIILGSLGGFLGYNYMNPGFSEKKVPVYKYNSKEKVNYEVLLKPNTLFNTKSIGEDQVYLSNLVDSINLTYLYSFTGQSKAEIKGQYEVIATLEGFSSEDDKVTTIWKKEIPLVNKTSFEATDNKFSLTKKVPLKLQDFRDITKIISDETKINTQTKITTAMNVGLSVNTDKGVIEKKETTSIELPLVETFFRIKKQESESKPEALEEVKQVPKTFDIRVLSLYGIGIGLSLIAFLFLLFETQNAKVDTFSKKLKRIFKKHGTRLVALNSEIAVTSELEARVHTMEDLVRISDELGKPIIYKHSYNHKENSKFWVIDEDRYFVFKLEAENSVPSPSGPSFKERVKAKGVKSNFQDENM